MGGTRVFQNAPLKWNDLTPEMFLYGGPMFIFRAAELK